MDNILWTQQLGKPKQLQIIIDPKKYCNNIPIISKLSLPLWFIDNSHIDGEEILYSKKYCNNCGQILGWSTHKDVCFDCNKMYDLKHYYTPIVSKLLPINNKSKQKILHIPLSFWFTKNTGLALPISKKEQGKIINKIKYKKLIDIFSSSQITMLDNELLFKNIAEIKKKNKNKNKNKILYLCDDNEYEKISQKNKIVYLCDNDDYDKLSKIKNKIITI